jgi:hypothetical protein
VHRYPRGLQKARGRGEKYWRSIQQQPRYKKLINELMVAHDDLDAGGQLSYPAFVRRRDEDRARASEHLETRARDLAAMTEVAGPDMLEALRAETGWLLPDGDVRAAVRRHGVSIAHEPWKLPPRPDRHCRGLAQQLTTLGLRLAAEAVRGGFRPGRGLTARADCAEPPRRVQRLN